MVQLKAISIRYINHFPKFFCMKSIFSHDIYVFNWPHINNFLSIINCNTCDIVTLFNNSVVLIGRLMHGVMSIVLSCLRYIYIQDITIIRKLA